MVNFENFVSGLFFVTVYWLCVVQWSRLQLDMLWWFKKVTGFWRGHIVCTLIIFTKVFRMMKNKKNETTYYRKSILRRKDKNWIIQCGILVLWLCITLSKELTYNFLIYKTTQGPTFLHSFSSLKTFVQEFKNDEWEMINKVYTSVFI